MEGNFSISKTSCEMYRMRHASGLWADIVVDAAGEKGRVQIASDYGNWTNYWGSCGCPFKTFLIELGIGYFAGKVRECDWFDKAATKRRLYADVKNARKNKRITAEEAAQICREAAHVFNSTDGKDDYIISVEASEIIRDFYDDLIEIPCVTGISPLFRRFFDEAWKAFVDELKKEIN